MRSARWVPRLQLSLGANTPSAKRLVFASAAIFMPVVPGVKFGYVMPAGACETLTRIMVH